MAGAVPTLCLCALLAGCAAAEPLPATRGGIELGLRRGAAWSTVTVKPPYAIGPRVNLHIGKGVFSGEIDGGAVNLRVDDQGVEGTGPAGSVAVDIEEQLDKLVIEGSWNGSRLHLEVTPGSMRGTIAVGAGGRLENVASCQYVLDRVDTSGARLGTSICGGMPVDTRLEIPGALQKWLTRPEMVVVLLALLSAPPMTGVEAI